MDKSRVVTANLNTQGPNKPPPYPLRQFCAIYTAGLLAVYIVLKIESWALVVAYPSISFFVSRFVSNRVIWWDQANNLSNIFHAKIIFWLLWPIKFPLFIFKLAASRYL